MDTAIAKPRAAKAQLDELALVHFRTLNHMSDTIRDWKTTAPVMVAESCARQVWMGLETDFADFPYPANNYNAVKLLTGADAYRFLLRLVTGNDSDKPGETNIAGQFFQGWQAYTKDQPAKAAYMDTLMQHVRADTAMIRCEITQQIKPVRHEMAARYLSGQKGGEHALVIGNVVSDKSSNLVTALFKALGNNRKARVNAITVTHPKTAGAVALEKTLKALQAEGFVSPDLVITRAKFEDLPQLMETHQRVYVDIPMETDMEADLNIMAAWEGRSNRTGTFTHMRGDPTKMGATGAFWKETKLDNFISPDDIRTEMARLGQENNRLKKEAERATEYCVTTRAARQSPSLAKYKKAIAATPAMP